MAWNERTGQNEPGYIDPIFNVGNDVDPFLPGKFLQRQGEDYGISPPGPGQSPGGLPGRQIYNPNDPNAQGYSGPSVAGSLYGDPNRGATTRKEPTFPSTTTPMGNFTRQAISSYSELRNALGIPRIGNSRVAGLINDRAGRTAEDQIGRFTDIRRSLNAPRLQDTEVARIINEGLLDPSSTPGFKLGQNLINERGRTQKEDFLSSIGRAGLGGSGIALKGLSTLGRQGDIDMGNLALAEGTNTRNAAISFAPKVEDSFWNEMNKALGLEEQGVSDLFSLEQASQKGFQDELGLGLRQEENVKNRELALKLQEMKNQGALGTAAGGLTTAALPEILKKLFSEGTTGSGTGAGTGSAAMAVAKQVMQKILGSGGGTIKDLTESLVNAGMTQQDASSLIQQIMAEDVEELAGIGQFDPSTFLSENNPFLSGGSDLSSIGNFPGADEFQNFADIFSPDDLLNFGDASTGAAGAGAGAAAGGIPADVAAGYDLAYGGGGGLLGEGAGAGGGFLDSIGLGGIAPFLTPLGIVGAGQGLFKLIQSLTGRPGPEWDKKRDKQVGQVAAEMKANPEAWLASMERDFGPAGRPLAQRLLQGPISPAELHSLLGLPADIDPQELAGAVGTGTFMRPSSPGLGVAPEFAIGQEGVKRFIEETIPYISFDRERQKAQSLDPARLYRDSED